MIFGQTLCLLPHFMCANSEGSDETAQMRRLAWAFAGETAQMRRLAWVFAGRLCDTYHNLMGWLNQMSRKFNEVHVSYTSCRLVSSKAIMIVFSRSFSVFSFVYSSRQGVLDLNSNSMKPHEESMKGQLLSRNSEPKKIVYHIYWAKVIMQPCFILIISLF